MSTRVAYGARATRSADHSAGSKCDVAQDETAPVDREVASGLLRVENDEEPRRNDGDVQVRGDGDSRGYRQAGAAGGERYGAPLLDGRPELGRVTGGEGRIRGRCRRCDCYSHAQHGGQ